MTTAAEAAKVHAREMREDDAAVYIQKTFRGHRTRNQGYKVSALVTPLPSPDTLIPSLDTLQPSLDTADADQGYKA
eukprot:7948114-Pyramimonas_sp.AAC.1